MKNMRFFPVMIFSIICLLCIANGSFSQQTAGQLFEKALYIEEAKGELQEAINLYQQILKQYPDNRPVAAKALLHVGLCNEKLGKNEAQKAYKQLISNFPGQKSEVAIAKERLSRLILAEEKTEKILPNPTYAKIKMPTNPGNGVLSPDGKRLAFIYDGCVWTIPVSGDIDKNIAGKPRKITDNINAWDMGNTFAWSGDGKWVAVNAKNNEKSSDMSIYIVPSEGGNPRKVQVPSHICGWPQEFRLSLSPDGKTLAYATGYKPGDWQNKFTRIYTIPVNGGDAKEMTGQGTQEPAYSPDGSKIAYVQCYKDSSARYYFSNIWVIPSKGGTPAKVSNFQSGQAMGPVWSPDGKMIAFLRRPEGQNPKELWIAPVTDKGNPSASAQKIDLPLESFHAFAGWSPDNKIGLQLMNPEYETIYTVNSKGGIATQVTPQGWNSYPKWSPDGKKIFFRGDRGMIAYVPAEGGVIDSIPIQSEFQMHTAVPGSGNEISPDGKTIVFSGARYFFEGGVKKWDVNLYTIPVEGGKPKQLTEAAAELQDRFPCWSPDGNTIAFIRPEIEDGIHIMHIYTVSKNRKNLKQISTETDNILWAPIDWTPDGKYITFFTNENTIRSIPADGGKSVFITNVDSVNNQFELAWSPDGKELAYTDQGKLWVYSPESGTTREVKTGVKASVTKIGWSPDGEKIAFTAYSGGDAELWMMENFLPLEKLAQNQEKPAKEPEGIKIKQIWKSPYLDDIGTVSYDGRFRSYVDWGVGNVGIHDLMTDDKKVLTDDAILGESSQFAENTVISQNGKQIAYSWVHPYNTTALRLINVDNPKPEIIYRKTGEELYPSAWLSDNEIVAFRFIPEIRTMQLVTFNILDKTIKVKKSFIPGQFGGLACSPDGKYLAYGLASDAEKGNLDIRLLQADGDGDIPLITHPSNDRVLGWVPGRNEFLFISDRSGSWDLWAIKLDGTKPSGPAKRIYADIGEVKPMGFTRDGKCYFGFVRRNFYSGLAPFNTETGKVDLESGQSLESQKYGITWSPDGQCLAYIKLKDNTRGNHLKLFLQDVKTGKEYQPDDNMLEISSYSWSPDGNSLLVRGRELSKLQEEGYKGGVFKVNVNTGRVDQIFLLSDYEYNIPKDDSDPLSWLEWAPDGKSFYYLFQKDRLVQHTLETGEDKILYKYADFMPYVLETSPNGKNLLFGLEYSGDEKGRLVTMPAEGGNEETLCTAQEAKRIEWAKYSPDGKYIYFVELPEGKRSVLWRVLAEGGNPEKLWSPENRVEIYDIHPDGNQVAFSIRERATEVRVIENLVQELEKIDKASE